MAFLCGLGKGASPICFSSRTVRTTPRAARGPYKGGGTRGAKGALVLSQVLLGLFPPFLGPLGQWGHSDQESDPHRVPAGFSGTKKLPFRWSHIGGVPTPSSGASRMVVLKILKSGPQLVTLRGTINDAERASKARSKHLTNSGHPNLPNMC